MNQIVDEPEIDVPQAETPAPKRRGRPPRQAPQRSEQRTEMRPEEIRLKRPTGGKLLTDMVDKARIPRGMVYQWNHISVRGMRDDKFNTQMALYHWKPVPASRHPEIFGPNAGNEPGQIEQHILYERPAYLNDEAYAEESMKANAQLGNQMAKFYDVGQSGIIEPSRKKSGLRRTYERGIPEDAA